MPTALLISGIFSGASTVATIFGRMISHANDFPLPFSGPVLCCTCPKDAVLFVGSEVKLDPSKAPDFQRNFKLLVQGMYDDNFKAFDGAGVREESTTTGGDGNKKYSGLQ